MRQRTPSVALVTRAKMQTGAATQAVALGAGFQAANISAPRAAVCVAHSPVGVQSPVMQSSTTRPTCFNQAHPALVIVWLFRLF